MYKDGYKVDILFLIEHRDRELDAVCAIAKILKSEYDLSVAIASLLFHSLIAAIFIRPKVIVFPFAYKSSNFPIALFRAIYGDSITYVNLNLEQILSPINKEYKKPSDKFTRLVLKQFCWSKAFKNFLLKNGVGEKNIYLTGNPTTSLLMKRVNSQRDSLRYSIEEHFKLPLDKKWLFFPMNCGWAFIDDYQIKSRVKEGYDDQKARTYRSYVSETLNIFLNWVAKAENKLKDKKILIILRPHPSVSVEQYKERFKNTVGYIPDYVYIIKDLTAKEWLVASDACYTNFSTVALDAQLIGKPTFLLEIKPYPSFIQLDWYKNFPKLKSFNDFCDSLTQESSVTVKSSNLIEEYVDTSLDGILETAKNLAKFAKEGKFGERSFTGLLKGIIINPRQTIGSFIRWLAAVTGVNPFQILKVGLKPDFFKKDDIVKLLKNQ